MGKHGRSALCLSWCTVGCRLESLRGKLLICSLDVRDTKQNPDLLKEVIDSDGFDVAALGQTGSIFDIIAFVAASVSGNHCARRILVS
eukprot:13439432-Alexandrium_andersonii.AAC.1